MVKKNDGIKESTDSSTTIEDEDTRGKKKIRLFEILNFFSVNCAVVMKSWGGTLVEILTLLIDVFINADCGSYYNTASLHFH
jgi:hypothetical protein